MFDQSDLGSSNGSWDQVISRLDEQTPPKTCLKAHSMEAAKHNFVREHDVGFTELALRLKALEDLQLGNRLASLEAFSLGSIDTMKEDRRVVQNIRVRLQSLEMRQELEARAAFLETQRLDGNILQLNDNLQPLKSELKEERQSEKTKGSLTERSWDASGLRDRVRSVERRCAAVELELNTASLLGKRMRQFHKSAHFHEDNALKMANVETFRYSERDDGEETRGAELHSGRSTVSSVPLAFYGANPTPPRSARSALSDKRSMSSPFLHAICHTQC
mmetsp:Transcript_88316/g.175568  ORF Transcript_88316/g.175568 Transcript_88316/m.175568 type:complete len:276 (+) Transcript_88316:47-874(+)